MVNEKEGTANSTVQNVKSVVSAFKEELADVGFDDDKELAMKRIEVVPQVAELSNNAINQAATLFSEEEKGSRQLASEGIASNNGMYSLYQYALEKSSSHEERMQVLESAATIPNTNEKLVEHHEKSVQKHDTILGLIIGGILSAILVALGLKTKTPKK